MEGYVEGKDQSGRVSTTEQPEACALDGARRTGRYQLLNGR